MLKLRIPYSGVIGLITGLVFAMPIAGLVAAICIEASNFVVIYRSLCSKNEFQYDSFIGHLLTQYVVLPDVSFYDILQLVCARVASYMVAWFILVIDINLLFLIIPGIVFLSTIIHYIPKQKSL